MGDVQDLTKRADDAYQSAYESESASLAIMGGNGLRHEREERQERLSLVARLKSYWMAFALRLGAIQTQILLFVLYFGVFGPGNLALRISGKDPLQRKGEAESWWVAHEPQDETLDRYRHQF